MKTKGSKAYDAVFKEKDYLHYHPGNELGTKKFPVNRIDELEDKVKILEEKLYFLICQYHLFVKTLGYAYEPVSSKPAHYRKVKK
jgi:hypothetical protein